MTNPILDAMEQVRQNALGTRVEVKLESASTAVLELLERNGASHESHEWIQTCLSDTCAHNSHPAGYSKDVFAIPATWQENIVRWGEGNDSATISRHFDITHFEDAKMTLLFIIPDEETGPRGIIEIYTRGWGHSCRALFPREELFRKNSQPFENGG